MFRRSPASMLLISFVSALILGLSAAVSATPLELSRWPGQGASGVFKGLVGVTSAQPTAAPAGDSASRDQPTGQAALERYNQGSQLQESAGDGRVRYYRRELPGGGLIAYFAVMLDQQVHVEVVNADGATPGTDASGDTTWADRQQHLETVEAMARAPYAARQNMTLLVAMAFGFHGEARTSDEGTVVIDGRLYHLNKGRAALCITKDGQARIGLFDADKVRACQQAIGAGPVVLLGGKVANPAVSAPDGRFVPYNPLGEDFTQIEWRRTVYTGAYPKSVIGVGPRTGGGSYLVMIVSYGVGGLDLVEQLRAMGCTDALGGDDDSSTQAVWRGAPVYPRPVSQVPDAVAVYLRQ